MPRGNPANVALGPGMLFYAVLGTAEPTDLTSAWGVGWIPLGYTAEGSTWSYALTSENVEVAEELDPIGRIATAREIKVGFAAAETTNKNLKLALNGGLITPSGTGATAIETFEPPELGDETYVMIGFESEKHDDRWVYRQSQQTGTVESQRQKGNAYQRYPMEFTVVKPATGLKPFKRITKVGVTG